MIWTGGMVMSGMLIEAGTGAAPKGWPRLPRPVALIAPAAGALHRIVGRWAGPVLVAAVLVLGVVIAYSPGAPIWKVLIAAWLIEHRRSIDALRAMANVSPDSLTAMQQEAEPLLGPKATQLDSGALIGAGVDVAARRFADFVAAPVFWFCVAGLPGMLVSVTVTCAAETQAGAALSRLGTILSWVPERGAALLLALAAMKPRALGSVGAGAAAMVKRVLDLPTHPQPTVVGRVIGLLWRAWSVMVGLAFVVWVSF